jgi:hypothetical protein
MNAEIAVGSLEHALKVVEAERIVGREGAHNPKPNALVNQSVEFGEFGRARHRRLLKGFASGFTKLLSNVPPGLSAFTLRSKRSSHRAS